LAFLHETEIFRPRKPETASSRIVKIILLGAGWVTRDLHKKGEESNFETTPAKLDMTAVSDSFRYAESKFYRTSVIHNRVSTEIQGGKCPHLEILEAS
jgi:hypothetical protein